MIKAGKHRHKRKEKVHLSNKTNESRSFFFSSRTPADFSFSGKIKWVKRHAVRETKANYIASTKKRKREKQLWLPCLLVFFFFLTFRCCYVYFSSLVKAPSFLSYTSIWTRFPLRYVCVFHLSFWNKVLCRSLFCFSRLRDFYRRGSRRRSFNRDISRISE